MISPFTPGAICWILILEHCRQCRVRVMWSFTNQKNYKPFNLFDSRTKSVLQEWWHFFLKRACRGQQRLLLIRKHPFFVLASQTQSDPPKLCPTCAGLAYMQWLKLLYSSLEDEVWSWLTTVLSYCVFNWPKKKGQTPHRLFWDFREDKTSIQLIGQPGRLQSSSLSPTSSPFLSFCNHSRRPGLFHRTIEGFDCKVNCQALGVAPVWPTHTVPERSSWVLAPGPTPSSPKQWKSDVHVKTQEFEPCQREISTDGILEGKHYSECSNIKACMYIMASCSE